MMGGLEFPSIPRAHVMQHENNADTGENRPQQMVRAGKIQRFQSGADNGAADLLHQADGSDRVGFRSEVSERKLNKLLALWRSEPLHGPVRFGFDSLARVCFLSVLVRCGNSNARTSQVERQMVVRCDFAGRL